MSRAAAERLEKLSRELVRCAEAMREADALSHSDAAEDWSRSIILESDTRWEARQACRDYLEDTAERPTIFLAQYGALGGREEERDEKKVF